MKVRKPSRAGQKRGDGEVGRLWALRSGDTGTLRPKQMIQMNAVTRPPARSQRTSSSSRSLSWLRSSEPRGSEVREDPRKEQTSSLPVAAFPGGWCHTVPFAFSALCSWAGPPVREDTFSLIHGFICSEWRLRLARCTR